MTKTPYKLNKEQGEAVKFGSGPLLIIAGAGTGKTTVITERIKYLVLSKKAKPSEILALTFTEKSARDMEERVDIALPYGYTEMWIMTFHAFCDRILRREALHVGLDPRFKLMTEAETIQLIRKNIFKFKLNYFRPLGNPNKFIRGMLQHFSRLQDENVSPKDYIGWVKNQKKKIKEIKRSIGDKIEIEKWEELANAFRSYEELKTKEGLMDYGDLIVKTLKVFKERPNILKAYRKQFKYFLVDEFQDTNYSQNELVKTLTGKHGNITVVADDDQSIYRFRGAAISNVVQFRKSFPKTKVCVLTKNYRSYQEILDKSYDLIQFNNPDRLEVVEKINKKLHSMVDKFSQNNSEDDLVTFIHSNRVENEAEEIVKTIKRVTSENDYSWGDFAILVRANNHAEPITRALARHGVPFQFLGPGRLFKQPEIIDLISYFKVLSNFEDSPSFYRLLSNDYFGISGYHIAKLGNYSKKYNLSLFEAAEMADEIIDEDSVREKIKNILAIVKKHLNIVKKESAGQILYYFLEETGMLKSLVNPENLNAQKAAKNISKFFDKLKSYEATHDDASIYAVNEWLDMSIDLGESPVTEGIDWTDIDAVNILTVHASKGLEFPVVFLVNLVAQRFPTTERREQIPIPEGLIKEILPIGDFHQQEERRLFYVGMTRAKERLFFTAADYYGEGKREKRLSPFIFEGLGKNVESGLQTTETVEQLSFMDFKPIQTILPTTDNILQPKVDYLSYSHVDTFNICPVHYKLKYIYKLPMAPSASQSFGSSMHSTLRSFYEEVAKKSKLKKGLIYDIYKINWIKEGYKDKLQEKEFYRKGKSYLAGYLKNSFDPKVTPVVLEQPFTINLHDKNKRQIKIGGTIDRVDKLKDGTIEIIDYKTGATIPSQKEVDKNLQLSFYGLAATKLKEAPFGVLPQNLKLSLYFLDTQEKISTTRTAEQLQKATDEIFEVRDKIESSDFNCSNHMFCQMGCEFSMFCKSDSSNI